MPRLSCIWLFIALVLPSFTHHAAAQVNGLMFPHNNGEFGSKGSLVLSATRPLEVPGAYKIAFAISIRQIRFGYILSIDDSRGEAMKLALVLPGGAGGDSACFMLSSSHGFKSSIPVPAPAITASRWLEVAVEVHPDTGLIVFSVGRDTVNVAMTVALPHGSLRLRFGHSDNDADVPPLALRNVTLSGYERSTRQWHLLHSWPLTETGGTVARDEIGDAEAMQTDCVWPDGNLGDWALVASIEAEPLSNAVFDIQRRELIVVGMRDLRRLGIDTGRHTRQACVTPMPGKPGFMRLSLDQARHRLQAYHTGTGQVSTFDASRATWSAIDTSPDTNQHYYSHLGILDTTTGTLYAFGGYGWFRTKSDLQRYDPHRRVWTRLPGDGEMRPEPRFMSVAAYAGADKQWFVFGGKGNQTGEQAQGYAWFSDLWMLDLGSLRWARKWKVDADTLNLTPIGLAHAGLSDSLYLLGHTQRGDTLTLRLFMLKASSPGMDALLDLPVIAQSSAPLFFEFDQARSEFLAAVRIDLPGKCRIDLYALRYPPRAPEPERSAPQAPVMVFGKVLGLVVVVAGLVFAGRGLLRRRTRYPSATVSVAPRKNSVTVFSAIHIYDATGTDRLPDLTPQLQEMFLMIMLHTRDGGGLPSRELTAAFWPYATPESAKNSRGVALNKLRDVLGHIGGIGVEWHRPEYLIAFGQEWYVEFQELCALLATIQHGTDAPALSRLALLLKRGEYLPGVTSAWAIAHRRAMNEHIASGCALAAARGDVDPDPHEALVIADMALRHDALHEPSLRMKVRAHFRLGQHGLAAEAFAQFTRGYQHVYGQPPPLTLSDLVPPLSQKTPSGR